MFCDNDGSYYTEFLFQSRKNLGIIDSPLDSTGECDITSLEKTVKNIGVPSRTKIITCKSTLANIINYKIKEYNSTHTFYVVKTTQRSIGIFLIVKRLSVTCKKTCDKVT